MGFRVSGSVFASAGSVRPVWRWRRPVVLGSFLSVVAAGLAVLPAAGPVADAAPVAAQAASAADSVRVPEQAELEPRALPGRANRYSATVRRPDGRYAVDSSAGPVNYRAEDGSWRPVETELVVSDAPGSAVLRSASGRRITHQCRRA